MPTTYELTDPSTGLTVTYVNPWIYDEDRSAWVADDVAYVTGDNLNNLLRFGQPFDPNSRLTGRFYRHDLEGTVGDIGPTVIFDQYNVLTRGLAKIYSSMTLILSKISVREDIGISSRPVEFTRCLICMPWEYRPS